MILANPTHIRSKWVMCRNQRVGGEVWKHPRDSLPELLPRPECMVNDYLVLIGPQCRVRILTTSVMRNSKGQKIS
jgi:hypothetical protein